MNKEYTYIDGKAIIEDENGTKTVTKYSDSLEEILVQENVVEMMEKRLEQIEQELQNNAIKQKYLKNRRFNPISTMTLAACLFPLVLNILLGDLAMQPLLGNVSIRAFMTIFSGSIFTYGCLLSAGYNSNYRETKKIIKGLNNERKHLENELTLEKQELKLLKKNREVKLRDKDFFVKKVDDKEVLKNLKKHLQLYYDSGYNENKYYRYYKKGILYRKLSKGYTISDIDMIAEHLENEKEHIAVKRKTRTTRK